MNLTFTASFDNIADFYNFVTGLASAPLPCTSDTPPDYYPEHLDYGYESIRPDHFVDKPERFFADNLPTVGTAIHWQGMRFEFDGVVESVDPDGDNSDNGKCVWVRRDDTDKRVSLTASDLDTGYLTAL